LNGIQCGTLQTLVARRKISTATGLTILPDKDVVLFKCLSRRGQDVICDLSGLSAKFRLFFRHLRIVRGLVRLRAIGLVV